jgi:hypothetical protein
MGTRSRKFKGTSGEVSRPDEGFKESQEKIATRLRTEVQDIVDRSTYGKKHD